MAWHLTVLLWLCALCVCAHAQTSCPCKINKKCAPQQQCADAGRTVGIIIGVLAAIVIGGTLLAYLVIGRYMRKRCCVCRVRRGKRGPTRLVYFVSPDGCCTTPATHDSPCLDSDAPVCSHAEIMSISAPVPTYPPQEPHVPMAGMAKMQQYMASTAYPGYVPAAANAYSSPAGASPYAAYAPPPPLPAYTPSYGVPASGYSYPPLQPGAPPPGYGTVGPGTGYSL